MFLFVKLFPPIERVLEPVHDWNIPSVFSTIITLNGVPLHLVIGEPAVRLRLQLEIVFNVDLWVLLRLNEFSFAFFEIVSFLNSDWLEIVLQKGNLETTVTLIPAFVVHFLILEKSKVLLGAACPEILIRKCFFAQFSRYPSPVGKDFILIASRTAYRKK